MPKKLTVDVAMKLDGEYYEAEVTGDFYPGAPGRTYGPPEDCFPPDPSEFDIIDLDWLDKPHRELTAEEWGKLCTLAHDKAADEYADSIDYGPEEDYDYDYDE